MEDETIKMSLKQEPQWCAFLSFLSGPNAQAPAAPHSTYLEVT